MGGAKFRAPQRPKNPHVSHPDTFMAVPLAMRLNPTKNALFTQKPWVPKPVHTLHGIILCSCTAMQPIQARWRRKPVGELVGSAGER